MRTCIIVLLSVFAAVAQTPNRITILNDAISDKPGLAPDWGYSAFVEFEGKRILFDTGNNEAIFKANIGKLKVDLTRLDYVVISHRHGDHTTGLRYVLSVNPNVPVYTPQDEPFLALTPPAFLTKSADSALPAKMRYFDGKTLPSPLSHGNAWPDTKLNNVAAPVDLAPAIHLVPTMSETPGFRDMPELSLVLDTPKGPIVIVGCSHPGIENILANITAYRKTASIFEVFGGIHLVTATDAQIERTLTELFDRYHLQRMAPGHCTGEKTLGLIQKRLGTEYVYAGLGETIPLTN